MNQKIEFDLEILQDEILIHSMINFWPVIHRLLDVFHPKKICEIGIEYGYLTEKIIEYSKISDCRFIGVDTKPNPDFVRKHKGNGIAFFKGDSEKFFLRDSESDICFIDGDHNYYTVAKELNLYLFSKNKGDRFIIFVHDVCWPWAHRDLYYDPKRVPKEEIHEYSYSKGVTIDNDSVIDGGFRGEGNWACAIKEGGEGNGVLTAINDLIASDEFQELNLEFIIVPVIFGMGIIYPKSIFSDKNIKEEMNKIHFGLEVFSSLLATLERNRLKLYLKVIELQDQLNS